VESGPGKSDVLGQPVDGNIKMRAQILEFPNGNPRLMTSITCWGEKVFAVAFVLWA